MDNKESSAFELLNIKRVLPTRRKSGLDQAESYFAVREEKNGRMSVVMNFPSEYLKSLGWDLTKDRVNLGSNGTLILLEPAIEGSYAVCSSEKYSAIDPNQKVMRSTRSEIKIQWREDICKEPKGAGRWKIQPQPIPSGSRTAIMFPLPNLQEVFVI